MIRMGFRCIYDRNLQNFYLCHKMKRTMAPLSMLKADIVWLNHINCLLMVFILEILHIVITTIETGNKKWFRKILPRPRPINISFLINVFDSVRSSRNVCSFVRSLKTCLELTIFIFLSFLAVLGQSQVYKKLTF